MADKKISALTSATTPLAGTEVLPIVQGGATVKVAVSDLTAARAVSMKSATVVGVADSLSESVRTNSFSGSVNGNSGIRMAAQCSDTKYNWLVGAQYNINQGFEITASTAVGGGTFNTPILSAVAPSGDVTVNTGNLVIGTSGKGIDFSATPGTGTSELLADYEEGTWTPTLTSTGATFAYAAETGGTYVKVGNVVTLHAILTLTSASGGTAGNALFFSNLPFTPGNPDVNGSGTGIGINCVSGGITVPTTYSMWNTSLKSGTSVLPFFGSTVAGGIRSFQYGDITSTAQFRFSLTYQTV